MTTRQTVLAFAASNSSQSINKMLVSHAATVLRDELGADVDINIIDMNDFEMPIYSSDREKADGIPRAAHDFYTKIGAADALLVSFAEHNGTYTAAFKNIFDWASRIDAKVYQDKPMVALATSPGPRGGQNVLGTVTLTAPFFGAEVKGSLSIASFSEHFDVERNSLKAGKVATELRDALRGIKSALAAA